MSEKQDVLLAEQEAKRQAGLLTRYGLLTSGSKRPLTPEELIEDRKRKAAQALARENKKKYDTNRDNYGKGQTKEGAQNFMSVTIRDSRNIFEVKTDMNNKFLSDKLVISKFSDMKVLKGTSPFLNIGIIR